MASVSITIAIAVIVVLRAPYFSITTVQISGDARTTSGAILEALEIGEGQALATYDTERGGRAVSELAWVDEVQVTRRWPSTLRVIVRERTPAAAIGRPSGTEWIVVDDDAQVLERRLTPPAGVPLIAAPVPVVTGAEVGTVIEPLTRVLAASLDLPLQLDPWIESWSVDATGRITAELVGSATADFGHERDHRTQFVSLASILASDTSLACIDTIDLSIADTPVIEREPQCVLASRDR